MRAQVKISVLVTALLYASAGAYAQAAGGDQFRGRYDGSHSPDRDPSSVTAMDQSNRREHVDLTAAIRSEVVRDQSLSTSARNVKIVTTSDGTVWLRGPVKTEAERARLLAIARREASGHRIEDGLTIARERATD